MKIKLETVIYHKIILLQSVKMFFRYIVDLRQKIDLQYIRLYLQYILLTKNKNEHLLKFILNHNFKLKKFASEVDLN